MRNMLVEVPDGVTLSVDGKKVAVTGPKGSVEKLFKARDLAIKLDGNKVEVESKDKAVINTVKAHIRNMIAGVVEGHKREMVVRHAHFPMKINVSGNTVVIDNFLGERKSRKAKIVDGAKVSVKGTSVLIEGADLEAVSQTAANIKQATKISKKDERVFQDGIYLVG